MTNADVPLLWVEQFRYLGIQEERDRTSFIEFNLLPILSQLSGLVCLLGLLATKSHGTHKLFKIFISQ